eukprot:329520-Amorphochlora_amoeboformis.AAC.1
MERTLHTDTQTQTRVRWKCTLHTDTQTRVRWRGTLHTDTQTRGEGEMEMTVVDVLEGRIELNLGHVPFVWPVFKGVG